MLNNKNTYTTMKRLILSLACVSFFGFSYAQGEMDALKYSQTDIMGSARYMSMGGAFGALGGEASSINVNPAGLGVYRKTELSFTPNIYINATETTSPSQFVIEDTRWNFNLNNFVFAASYLTGKDEGLVASNFGVSYNRNKNFHSDRYMKTQGTQASISHRMAQMAQGIPLSILMPDEDKGEYPFDGSVSFLTDLARQSGMINPLDWDNENQTDYVSLLNNGEKVDNSFSLSERGNIGEWNFSYAANISDVAYLGASLGVQSINYQMSSLYKEDFYEGGHFYLRNNLETSGTGLNLKLATILRPLDFMRLGFAFHTPTFYSLEDTYSSSVDFNTTGTSSTMTLPWGTAKYELTTPYKFIGSMAFVIAQKAIVSADYEMQDYGTMKFGGTRYVEDNQDIKRDFTTMHTVRLGAEYRLTDQFSLRGGYAFSTSPVKSTVEDADYSDVIYTAGTTANYTIPQDNSTFSGGFGYREGSFFLDMAYQYNLKNENLYPYFTSAPTEVSSNTSNIVCTFGWKF
jgi:long-subunit fatty acid transport protein